VEKGEIFEVYPLRVGRFLHLKDGVRSFPFNKKCVNMEILPLSLKGYS
jgi:hypothetical protein